jgi:hypothetical protein
MREMWKHFGTPEKALKLRNIALPVPGSSQVAMKVKSVGLSQTMKETMTHPNILPNTALVQIAQTRFHTEGRKRSELRVSRHFFTSSV